MFVSEFESLNGSASPQATPTSTDIMDEESEQHVPTYEALSEDVSNEAMVSESIALSGRRPSIFQDDQEYSQSQHPVATLMDVEIVVPPSAISVDAQNGNAHETKSSGPSEVLHTAGELSCEHVINSTSSESQEYIDVATGVQTYSSLDVEGAAGTVSFSSSDCNGSHRSAAATAQNRFDALVCEHQTVLQLNGELKKREAGLEHEV